MFVIRRMLPLAVGISTLAGMAFAFAFDEGSYRIAMGPTSAPMKPGGIGAGNSVCAPTDPSCARPHQAKRHRRARAALQR